MSDDATAADEVTYTLIVKAESDREALEAFDSNAPSDSASRPSPVTRSAFSHSSPTLATARSGDTISICSCPRLSNGSTSGSFAMSTTAARASVIRWGACCGGDDAHVVRYELGTTVSKPAARGSEPMHGR
jgi:hypothetical protein